MSKLNIVGSAFGETGYDAHTKNLGLELQRSGVNVSFEGPRPAESQVGQEPELLEILNNNFRYDTTLMINLPDQWRLKISEMPEKFIGYCVWEGDKVPVHWKEIFNDDRINQIWVASNHTKLAIENTKISTDKVRVVPHGVNTDIFKPIKVDRDNTFTFMANKGWSKGMEDRGGIQYAMLAFKQEFTKKDNVKMIVKINMAYNNPNWDLAKDMLAIGIDKYPDGQNIHVIPENIPYHQLPELYNKGDCFVCPTRSEAFGLTMAEAMACGLPVITTNFGGQTDFVNNENGWLIDYTLENVKGDLMYEGIKWAVPDMIHLRKCMREAYENRDITRAKGLKALTDIQNFTWQNSSKTAIKHLEELE